jgi:hypothetical protein
VEPEEAVYENLEQEAGLFEEVYELHLELELDAPEEPLEEHFE